MLRSGALVWPPLATKLLLRGPTLSRPLIHPVTRVAIRVPFPQCLTACLSSAVRSRVSRLCLVHSYICIQPIFTMAALSSVVLQSFVISLNLPIHSLPLSIPTFTSVRLSLHSLLSVYPYIHFRPSIPTFTSVRLPLHSLPSVYPYIHFHPSIPTFTSVRLSLHSLPSVYPYIHFRPSIPTFTSIRLSLHSLPSVYPYIDFRPFTPTFTSVRLPLYSLPSIYPYIHFHPLASSFITALLHLQLSSAVSSVPSTGVFIHYWPQWDK